MESFIDMEITMNGNFQLVIFDGHYTPDYGMIFLYGFDAPHFLSGIHKYPSLHYDGIKETQHVLMIR